MENRCGLWYSVSKEIAEETSMTDIQQRAAAKKFVEYWSTRGDEKQETALFWIDLLQNKIGRASCRERV